MPTVDTEKPSRAGALLQSGIFMSALGLLAQGIHFAFQFIISPLLDSKNGGHEGEFGLVGFTIAFIGLFSLPSAIAVQAVTHYIARFHYSGDDARLNGLLEGCRKFLFQITIAGSVIAILLIKPLGDFYHIPRVSLTFIALVCVLGGLWTSYAGALCQGFGWFKRLALIGLLAAIFRLAIGWPAAKYYPYAESAVLGSVAMLLPNLLLFFWRKDFPQRVKNSVSPWNRELGFFLLVATANGVGTYCFQQSDLLVAKRFFPDGDMDAYNSAGLLARALLAVAAPLLTVLFTHRSSRHNGYDAREQLKVLGFYAVGLVVGAGGILALGKIGLRILHRDTPVADGMILWLTMTMVFVGLLQALAMWALASRWSKVSLLYGILGCSYLAVLFVAGHEPSSLLRTMPIGAGVAFVVLLFFWLRSMRRHHPEHLTLNRS
jgi:O-antigen/teichoic acid export membrane protein